jgi:PAS domain S-box-containing protein
MVAAGGIVISDWLVHALFPYSASLNYGLTVKEWCLVFVIAGLLLCLVRVHFHRRLSATQRRRQEDDVERINRLYSVLSQVNHAVLRSRSRQEVFESVCQAALTYGGFRLAWVGWRDPQTAAVNPVACGGDAAGFLPQFRMSTDNSPEGRGPTGTAIREGRTVVCNDLASDPAAACYRKLSAQHGIRSAAAFPIRVGSEVGGALILYAAEPGFFRERELALLEEAAGDVSFALGVLEKDAQRRQAEEALRIQSTLLEATLNSAPHGILVVDAEGHKVLHNQRTIDLLQIPREIADNPDNTRQLQVVSSRMKDPEQFSRKVLHLYAHPEESCREEIELLDGTVLDRNSAPILGKDGRYYGRIWTFCDITGAKRAEQALREANERLAALIEGARDAVILADAQTGIILDANQEATHLLHRPKEALIGLHQTQLHPPDHEAKCRSLFQMHATQPRAESAEIDVMTSDGLRIPVEISASVVEITHGRRVVQGIFRDISARKAAATALQRQESLLSSYFRASPVGLCMARDRVLLEVNDRLCEIAGYSREELIGKCASFLYASQSEFERVSRELDSRIHSDPVGSVESRWRRKDGTICDVLMQSSLLDPANPAAGMTCAATDITERNLAQERIREQAALLDQTQDAILVVGVDRRILYCNRTAERLYGSTSQQMLGQQVDSLAFPDKPEQCAQVCEAALQNGIWSGELRLTTAWSKPRSVFSRWTPVHNAKRHLTSFLIVNTDITEKKRLEEQFLRSQRMESIGTLASGVAHDLNNVLTPIMLAIEILSAKERSPQDLAMLQMLGQNARRGADIIRQLLTFGRGVEGLRIDLQPRPLLNELAKIITETFPKSIKLEQRFADELWSIHADATQIHQVLLNLCVNARDAMPRGGTLTLTAENVMLDPEYTATNPEAKPGPCIVMAVADTGSGIPPELMEKIFDPFFTTKEPGKGTGLGLSTVMGIVKSHGGFVQVASRLNEGTRFKVYLPSLASHNTERFFAKPARLPGGRGQLILVVDDEESVRVAAKRMLESHGYRVLVAVDGAEGLVAYSQERKAIHAVLTDMIMPVMDGPALIRVLRGASPNLRVIAMSGLSAQEEEAFKPANRADAFLGKPFTSEQLLVTLNQLLAPVGDGDCPDLAASVH